MIKTITAIRLFLLSVLLSMFIIPVSAQQNVKLINQHLSAEREKNNWLPGDISDWIITDQYTDKTTGLTYVYIQQRHKKIAVYNAISNFLIKDVTIVHFKPGIINHLESKVNASIPSLNPKDAFYSALVHLGKEKVNFKLLREDEERNTYLYEAPEISSSPVKIQLVYRQKDHAFILAWDVSIELKDEPHWWNIRIDALTGDFIDKNDYTVECIVSETDGNVLHDHFADEEISAPASAALATPEYNVFAYPHEAPSFGSRSLLSAPWDPGASPYGWHDTNGAIGEEYNITRGNNAFAYEDAGNNNNPGYSPSGGLSFSFDFPFTSGAAPTTNQDASITNLFYANNRIHDYLYNLGFNEAAGNFQQNNYGNGGLGNDYVKAEAFDGSGSNNANFSTPPDGFSGRMQMYLWTGNSTVCTSLNVSSSTYTGPMTAVTAQFSSTGTATGNLILVNDGSGTVTDGCSAIQNNVAGKIVLIDRGLCNLINKAQFAQAAGAIGVLIANNTGAGAFVMPGSPQISIPCVSISQADGVTLKSALQAGVVNVTMTTCIANGIDGSFDNGIIAHEFGHGLSNRLTGGPSQASCLVNAEQGGEGWSDWLSLIMTIEPGDAGTDARGIGTYAKGQPTTGPGIRRFPYSTNMAINPQTYGNLATSSGSHQYGEIWCDAIWDMSWFLIDDHGFSTDPYNATAGNNIAIRLVLEGMKLQPCGPGFLDARDAILLADAILYNNAHRCRIWEAFARRGMGYNASQGNVNTIGDENENFDLPPFCLPATQVPDAAYTSDVSSLQCGGKVQFTDQSVQPFQWLWNFDDQTTSTLQNPKHTFTAPGTYNVKLKVTNPMGTDSVTHVITVSPAFAINTTVSRTEICLGEEVEIGASASGTTNRSYNVEAIPYSPVTGSGTSVNLSDDEMSTSRPIGFTFNFYGQDYTNFYLSSNGLITFTGGQLPQPVYGQIIPSTVNPNNFIALAWNDLYPPASGSTINFFTTGTVPDRKLIVNYDTYHYAIAEAPFTQYPFKVQAILSEGSNTIELHTTVISNVSPFDGGATTTQGIENVSGTAGVPVPGRNGVIFSASNDAYRFTQFIPYSFNWLPGNLNGQTQIVTPAASGTYTVFVSDGTACNASVSTPSITVNTNCRVLDLTVLIEGYYRGNGEMIPLLYELGISGDPTACDTVTIELHDAVQTNNIAATAQAILHTDGRAVVVFPDAIQGGSYYIVVRHRHSITTWSRNPVVFSGQVTPYNFLEF